LRAKTTLSFKMVGTIHTGMEHYILKARALCLVYSSHSAALIIAECSQSGEYENWFFTM